MLALAARDKTACARDCIAASHDSTDVESGGADRTRADPALRL